MLASLPCHFSHVWFFVTLWTIAHQAPLSMGFSRQQFRSRGFPWGSSGWESALHCRGRWLYPRSRRVPRAAERLCPCAIATEPALWGPWATPAEPMCLDSVPHSWEGRCSEGPAHRSWTEFPTQQQKLKIARKEVYLLSKKKKKYWSGSPCPPAGDLPDPGIEPRLLCLLHWQAGSLLLVPPGKPFTCHKYAMYFL